MSSFFILIPLSLGMGLVGLGAFVWALRSAQFDDPAGNAARILGPNTRPDPDTSASGAGSRADPGAR